MAISLVTVGGKITAAIMNAIIKAVNGIALNGVVPSSVTVGSGTITTAANGQIIFTGASSVSVNGVFSGTYDNYRITWNAVAASAATTANLRLRNAGTDDTSAKYDWVRSSAAGTSVSTSSSSSGTNTPLDASLGTNQISNGVLDLFGPAEAFITSGNALSSVLYASALTACTVAFANENSATYDGFTFYPNAAGATLNGVLRVYGYNTLS